MKPAPTRLHEHFPYPNGEFGRNGQASEQQPVAGAERRAALPLTRDLSTIALIAVLFGGSLWLILNGAVPDGMARRALAFFTLVLPPTLASLYCIRAQRHAGPHMSAPRGWSLLATASASAAVLAAVSLEGQVSGLSVVSMGTLVAIAGTLAATCMLVATLSWIGPMTLQGSIVTALDLLATVALGYLLASSTNFLEVAYAGSNPAGSFHAIVGIAFPLVVACAFLTTVAALSQVGHTDLQGQVILAAFGCIGVLTGFLTLAFLNGKFGGDPTEGFAHLAHADGVPMIAEFGWVFGFTGIAAGGARMLAKPAQLAARQPLIERSSTWAAVWALVPFGLLAAAIVLWGPGSDVPRESRGALVALLLVLVARCSVMAFSGIRQSQTLHIDPLTGALNHRSFQERITPLADRSIESRIPISLVMIDIDDFELLNDASGHAEGDLFLREIASTIASRLDPKHVLFRSGGDEFAIAMPGATAPEAEQVARTIATACESVTTPTATAPSLTIGIATLPTHTFDPHELVRLAEGALYWGKLSGKHSVTVYDPKVVKVLTAEERVTALEQRSQLRAVLALARALDARDSYTARHSQNVARNALAIAIELGWDADQAEMLRIAGLLHDVGKIGVPDSTLSKSGDLTAAEWEEMRRHPVLSARMIDGIAPEEAIPWVLAHHERMDGRGYPERLSGDMVPLGARILAVADSFDAMTSSRSYRPAMTGEWAISEIKACVGQQFDPEVVEAFLRAIESGAIPIDTQSADIVTISGVAVTPPIFGLSLDPEFRPDLQRDTQPSPQPDDRDEDAFAA